MNSTPGWSLCASRTKWIDRMIKYLVAMDGGEREFWGERGGEHLA
jgi:hypothetical protein